jgi:hypothetical protein
MSFYDYTFGLCIPPPDPHQDFELDPDPEVACTVRLAIGFKQMLFIFATCYWF